MSSTNTTSSHTPQQYNVKIINFFGDERSILLQNENGPCPLLALCNVLLLRNAISLPKRAFAMGHVTFEDLVEILSNKALDEGSTGRGEGGGRSADIAALVNVLPSLNKGLDVNPKFCQGVTGYEYTEQLVPFDIFGVELVHGWLLDVSDPTFQMFEKYGYNQLVEMIISAQSDGGDTTVEAEVAKSFLDNSAHQLTFHGLTSLHSHIRENALAVFFRNNHFSTIFKHEEKLLLLVTDQGYATVSEIVWEVLTNIDGDTAHVNGDFQTPSLMDDYSYTNTNSNPSDDALQAAIAASLAPNTRAATAASTRIITYGPGHSATVAAMPPNVAVGVSLADKKETTPQPSDEQIAQQLQYQINLEESSRHDEDLARQYQLEENQNQQRRRDQEQRRPQEKKRTDSSCSIM